MNVDLDLRSALHGVLAMRPGRGRVNYAVRRSGHRFCVECWTPVWHEGRGPYLSLGLGVVAIYRGY